jgi:hypothetical protein
MDLKYHHLAVLPEFTIRVILYDFLKTVERLLIVFLIVPGMGINNSHLEENSVRYGWIFLNNLPVFAQRLLVFSLVEKIICLPGDRSGPISLIEGTASEYKNLGYHDAEEEKAKIHAASYLP